MSKPLLRNRIIARVAPWLACTLFVPVPARLLAQSIGTNSIALDHLVLETTRIDSVARAFVLNGFDVRFDVLHSLNPVDTVVLNHLTRIEIRHHTAFDPNDSQFSQLSSYYSAVVFRTPYTSALRSILILDSDRLGPTFYPSDDTNHSAFGIAGGGPLDLIFMDGDLSVHDPDMIDRNRIDWLILTAGVQTKRRLSETFDAIGLTKKHEGCCDYWMIGPAPERMKIRFDADANPPDPEWLSIEALGVIYGR